MPSGQGLLDATKPAPHVRFLLAWDLRWSERGGLYRICRGRISPQDSYTRPAAELKPQRPEVSDEAWETFKKTMYGGDFLFNVSRDFVKRCQTPLLVLMGNDLYHPAESSREIAALAPNATFIEKWKEPEHQPAAKQAVERFLAQHTPR